MVPPLQNCRFCENCFWHNLKTNEVKYIKVHIFRKEISQGIYLNHQIFGYFLKMLAFSAKKTEILAKKWFFGQNFQK